MANPAVIFSGKDFCSLRCQLDSLEEEGQEVEIINEPHKYFEPTEGHE